MLRTIVLLVTIVTGATGLVYEVAWQKYLATLLGSHSEATATVLGLFLAGLSLGYHVFGRIASRVVTRARAAGTAPRLLPVYAVVEASIGVYAFAFPTLFEAAQAVSLFGPAGAGAGGFVFDVGLAALLILPPTILMGGTIPLLTQGLSRSVEDATRFHALVYGFNTAGAFVGALAAGFVLVPWLGLRGVMWSAGLVNVVAGVLLGWLGRRERVGESPPAVGPGGPIEGLPVYIGVALLTGFAMMGVQTVLNRIGALAFGSSPFTFSMVAALFVSCIAAGSLLVSALPRIPPKALLLNQAALLTCLLFLDDFLPNAPFWGHVLRTTHSNTNLAYYAYLVAGFVGMLLLVGPAPFFSGASLPLVFHQLKRNVGDLGATAGTLYAWNTLGSLLGAMLVGYVLLFWLDLHQVYRLSTAAVVLSVALLVPRTLQVGRLALVAGTGIVLAYVAVLEPWDPARLNSGLFRMRTALDVDPYTPSKLIGAMNSKLIAAKDDPTASISVHEMKPGMGPPGRSIHTNGKSDSSTSGDAVTLGLSAMLPALVVPQLETVFVVGWGTGVTVGELASLESVREVVVAEISPAVLEMRSYFAEWDLGATGSPKVRVVRGDAYRALRRSKRRFDAIVSEPSNPWVSGVEMLYAREFLESASSRLEPGGVFLQWIHQYEMDAEALGLVLRTYGAVFPEVAVWYGQGPDLLLLGCPTAGCMSEPKKILARAARPDIAAALRRAGIDSVPELLAHELWPAGVLRALQLEGPLHTLYHPRLNHTAVQAFFRGASADLPFAGFGRAAEIARRGGVISSWLRGAPPSDEERATLVTEACEHRRDRCGALLADWLARAPDSSRAREVMESLRLDGGDRFGGEVSADDVVGLARLATGANGATPVAWGDAVQATRRFVEFHTPLDGVPARRLLDVWRRCAADEAEPCEDGLRRVRRLLETGEGAEELRRAGSSRHGEATAQAPPALPSR